MARIKGLGARQSETLWHKTNKDADLNTHTHTHTHTHKGNWGTGENNQGSGETSDWGHMRKGK